MSENNYFDLIPERTRVNLLHLAAQVAGVVPVETGTFTVLTGQLQENVRHTAIVDELAKLFHNNCTYLYYLRVMNNPNLAEVERSFLAAKQSQKNQRAYPRLNRQSNFFYVGSSSNMIQRFKEHLGYGSDKTYSMQLSHWARNLNLKIEFIYAKYSFEGDIVQLIEDTLWDELSPMFGRKGRR